MSRPLRPPIKSVNAIYLWRGLVRYLRAFVRAFVLLMIVVLSFVGWVKR